MTDIRVDQEKRQTRAGIANRPGTCRFARYSRHRLQDTGCTPLLDHGRRVYRTYTDSAVVQKQNRFRCRMALQRCRLAWPGFCFAIRYLTTNLGRYYCRPETAPVVPVLI